MIPKTYIIKIILIIAFSYAGIIAEIFTTIQIMSVLLLVLLLDLQHILCLRNYFLIYSFIIFIIAPAVIYPDENLEIFFFKYTIAFIIGYAVYLRVNVIKSTHQKDKNIKNVHIEERLPLVEQIFIILIYSQILLIILTIVQSGGLANYLSGDSLISKIDNYKKKDVTLGVFTIINQMTSIFSFASFVLLMKILLERNQKKYGLIAVYLILLPLLSLARGQMSFNLILFILIYTIYDNRKGIIKMKEYLIIGLVFSLIIVYGSLIGGLRSSHWVDNSSDSISDLALVAIGGELSPVIVFRDIVTDHEKLGMKYGMTIIPPLLLKIIPSNIYTDKPDNTISYYSKIYSPESFEQGHMLASTIFSDLYLNFGAYGSIFFICIIGIFIAYFDNIYINGIVDKSNSYLIVYFYFYSFLRNDIANSVSMIILTLIAYQLLNLYINHKLKQQFNEENSY